MEDTGPQEMRTEYTARRRAFAGALKGGSAILTGHDALQSRADGAYPFVQQADFFYLTGINEPRWQCLYDASEDIFILVAPHVSASRALFDGALTWDEARAISGIETIIRHSDLLARLRALRAHSPVIHTIVPNPGEYGDEFALNPAATRLTRQLARIFEQVQSCRAQLMALRVLKSPIEIEIMRRAIAATAEGFEEVRAHLGRGAYAYEYEIEATLSDAFRRTGAEGHAYSPIVAGGIHACTLHYAQNSAALESGQFVLIDAGAKYQEYAADVTRTLAVGAVSARHQAVHRAVEHAHQQIVALLRPGLAVRDYSQEVDRIVKRALHELELLDDMDDDATYRKYFPHAISHGLGIDVHESLGGFDTFMPGMVLTVEPGIYIPEEGIGVRIEDDILITEDGHENLTASIPTSL